MLDVIPLPSSHRLPKSKTKEEDEHPCCSLAASVDNIACIITAKAKLYGGAFRATMTSIVTRPGYRILMLQAISETR